MTMDQLGVLAEKLFSRCILGFVLCCLLASVGTAQAQDVVINWSTQTMSASPSKVYNTMVVNVRLENANDLLYDYKIDITATPRNPNDFGTIADLLMKTAAPAAAPGAPTPCQLALHAAENSVTTLKGLLATKNTPVNPDEGNGKFSSVKVANTVAYWKSSIQPQDDLMKQAVLVLRNALAQNPTTCSPAEVAEATDFLVKTYGPLRASLDSFESRLDAPHQIVVPVTLSPENDYKIVVTESYQNHATDGGSQTFNFSPESDILTLSAGTLLTEVQNRTYTSGALPGQTGNFLLVSGNSPIRPVLVAQLNYRIPKLSWDSFGFALSSGSALQFTGGNSGVSNVGFFGGISAHFWKRFYVTPGIHVGEFADFPPGFTAPNQPIPSGFGQLNPNKRWTARFAIGITYKALDFTKFTSGGGSKKQ
jgi:hypothetical protein